MEKGKLTIRVVKKTQMTPQYAPPEQRGLLPLPLWWTQWGAPTITVCVWFLDA